MSVYSPLILSLDIAGYPIDWLPWQDAVCLQVRGQVAWATGNDTFQFHGGLNGRSGVRSIVTVNSIIAIRNARAYMQDHVTPVLTNAQLFRRDRYTCLYYGQDDVRSSLTRDHVIPRSRGGEDVWSNVVTACKKCNSRKDNRTPEEARMPLLALPYTPNRVEALILRNRRILGDQAEFLSHLLRKRDGL